jgi:hypothetical protein
MTIPYTAFVMYDAGWLLLPLAALDEGVLVIPGDRKSYIPMRLLPMPAIKRCGVPGKKEIEWMTSVDP